MPNEVVCCFCGIKIRSNFQERRVKEFFVLELALINPQRSLKAIILLLTFIVLLRFGELNVAVSAGSVYRASHSSSAFW